MGFGGVFENGVAVQFVWNATQDEPSCSVVNGVEDGWLTGALRQS